MDILYYGFAVIVGITMGLMGGGGSILTVPLLVYGFQIEPVLATAYSLFLVGTSSLMGSFTKFRQGNVAIKAAVIFGAPSIVTIFFTRAYLLPLIPDELFSCCGFMATKNIALMVLFAFLMISASYSMISAGGAVKNEDHSAEQKGNIVVTVLNGSVVGVLTGLVGAGGGFLIVPALAVMQKLPMKIAVGTSMAIISANALVGFAGDVRHADMDWQFLFSLTGLSILGVFIGNIFSAKITGMTLRKSFGWFILCMGIYILLKETILR